MDIIIKKNESEINENVARGLLGCHKYIPVRICAMIIAVTDIMPE